jgi:hypothetical protein
VSADRVVMGAVFDLAIRRYLVITKVQTQELTPVDIHMAGMFGIMVVLKGYSDET